VSFKANGLHVEKATLETNTWNKMSIHTYSQVYCHFTHVVHTQHTKVMSQLVKTKKEKVISSKIHKPQRPTHGPTQGKCKVQTTICLIAKPIVKENRKHSKLGSNLCNKAWTTLQTFFFLHLQCFIIQECYQIKNVVETSSHTGLNVFNWLHISFS
jgi:hypothetical protein